tara:strand:+ start:520 stop:675 length:156 start_codon:yes stop_codon:yes gene_type:complete
VVARLLGEQVSSGYVGSIPTFGVGLLSFSKRKFLWKSKKIILEAFLPSAFY